MQKSKKSKQAKQETSRENVQNKLGSMKFMQTQVMKCALCKLENELNKNDKVTACELYYVNITRSSNCKKRRTFQNTMLGNEVKSARNYKTDTKWMHYGANILHSISLKPGLQYDHCKRSTRSIFFKISGYKRVRSLLSKEIIKERRLV